MSYVISARIPETMGERIRQYARSKQRSINEVVRVAVEEWLRQNEFAHIEFRDTPDGRIAYMKGSRLPVWRGMWPGRTEEGLACCLKSHFRRCTPHSSEASFSTYPAWFYNRDLQKTVIIIRILRPYKEA